MLGQQVLKRLLALAQLTGAALVAWNLLAFAACVGEHINRQHANNYFTHDNQAICLRCIIDSGPLPWFLGIIGDKPELTFIAVSAIATIFIACFTYTLQQATVNLSDRQTSETKILQRAYISVKPLGINPFVSEHGGVADRIVGHVAFINVGRLPARNVSVERAYMKWDSSDSLGDADLLIGPIRPMTIVLTPGTTMSHGTNSIPTTEMHKSGFIYVWGKVDYTDGFGVTRHTQFCHRYPCIRRRLTGKGETISRKHARYHQNGNGAD